MSDIGLIIDRGAIPQIIAVIAPALIQAQVERSGLTFSPEQAIFVNEAITENPTWSGTKSGATVTNGQLLADTPAFWGADGSAFWGANGAAFWDALSAWTYTYTVTPSAGAAGNTLRVAYTSVGTPVITIEWREDGAGVWNAYDDDAGIPTSSGHDYEIMVSGAAAGDDNGLEILSSFIAVPAQIERVYAQNIQSSGTRLPLALTYTAITSVVLELLPYSSAVSAAVLDNDETLGPLVECYDAFGTEVFGVVNAVIYGY